MTTFSEIREALGSALGSIDGLAVSSSARPTVSDLPAALVFAGSPVVAYDATFANGSHDWTAEVLVLVSRGTDDVQAQDAIDAFTAPAGASSIKAAIEADMTLGAVVHIARVASADIGTVSVGGVEYFAATFTVEVTAS